LHFLELDPEGDHIALGGDLDGCDTLAEGFDGVQSYPAMAQRLLERGVGDKIVRKIYWDNALEVMEKCCI
jgi:microsomal dipeptidase-like Zn-dependent dipeptidase